jgi:hypothetical protein
VGRCEVGDFGSEVLIVDAIVEVASWESLSMSLEGLDLFYLTAVWQAYIVYTEDVVGIVTIRRQLT